MIGKFVVYEGAFRDRFVCREVVGETKDYWRVRNPSNLDERRIKKSSYHFVRIYDTAEAGEIAAKSITTDVKRLHDAYLGERANVLAGFQP